MLLKFTNKRRQKKSKTTFASAKIFALLTVRSACPPRTILSLSESNAPLARVRIRHLEITQMRDTDKLGDKPSDSGDENAVYFVQSFVHVLRV